MGAFRRGTLQRAPPYFRPRTLKRAATTIYYDTVSGLTHLRLLTVSIVTAHELHEELMFRCPVLRST